MAEANIPPAFQLKELLASYPKIDDTYPSSWFVWSDDPNIKPRSWFNKVCHAEMRFTPKGYDYLITAVPKADKVSLGYLRMLIHGPFKGVSDLISLVKTKGGQYYLQCSELKKWPAPVLFNFCVASRAPIEFQNQLHGWVDLLNQGYPEVLAFLLSHSVGGKKFKHQRDYPEHGHHWFDPSSDWTRIIDGKPDLSGLNYCAYPTQVTPSNVIWGNTKDWDVVRKMDDIKAAEYFGFKHPPPKTKFRDPNELNKKKLYWDMEAAQPIGANNDAALAQFMAHVNQINPPAPQINQWAFNLAAEVAIPQPVAPPQPVIDDDEPDFADWPDYADDADD